MTRMSPWKVTTDKKLLRRIGKLLEELGELQAVAARVIIQGIDEIDPSSGRVNRARLLDELADAQAQINCTMALLFPAREDNRHFLHRVLRKEENMQDWESQVEGEEQ